MGQGGYIEWPVKLAAYLVCHIAGKHQALEQRVDLLKQEINEYYSHYCINNDLIELRNLVHVAELIVRSAVRRHESRGLHFNLDFPETAESVQDTIMFPGSIDQLDMLKPSA